MRTFFLFLLAAQLLDPSHARADEASALTALRRGEGVALMRHADAPGGTGDPVGFRLDDCSTQRNLSAKGRADAATVGRRLKTEGAVIGKLISSPWCRCVDTARLMDLGTVHTESTFSNVVVLSDRRSELTQGARKLIGAWKGPGTLLVVTHGANIQALTGYNPSQAEIVVVSARADGSLQEVGRLPPPAQ